MQSVTIKGTVRTELGSKFAKAVRAAGDVPCVIYGGKEPIHFSAPILAFRELVYTSEALVAHIELDGKTIQAVIQDMQFDPLTDKLTHMDLIEVVEGKPVTIEVPVVMTGNARGVRNGGKLKSVLRSLKIKGHINDLPSVIEHDITDLRIGQSIRVSDMKDGKPFEVLNAEAAVVVTIKMSRKAVSEEEEAEEAAEGAEATAEAAVEGAEANQAAAE
ncbi:MAG TPA: 50S ribosomal protein L25 [Cryomorphaceae bacterium]|jgi:large subunit ribosomal protein L25|nr:50S ribosomal protein L25 [Schleiferiaceae bacterium]HBJ71975.1 50S ribosomal protein L25 [Cryomorphaceae bacterium]